MVQSVRGQRLEYRDLVSAERMRVQEGVQDVKGTGRAQVLGNEERC